MFNALKYIKNLEAVGFRREQAEAQVQLVLEAIEDEVATRSDMAELRSDFSALRGDLRKDMAELRADMSQFKGEIRAEISEFKGEIRAEISELKTDIVFKLGATTVACTTLMTAVLGFLIKS